MASAQDNERGAAHKARRRLSDRFWSAQPYTVAISPAAGRRIVLSLGVVLAIGLSIGIARATRTETAPFGQFNPHCGGFPADERAVLATLNGVRGDADLKKRLTDMETLPQYPPQTQAAAHRIRLQCGLLFLADEYASSAGVQLASMGIELTNANAEPVAAAVKDATYRYPTVEVLEVNGRFDIANLLRVELSLAPSSPPTAFDSNRGAARQVMDDVNEHRTLFGR